MNFINKEKLACITVFVMSLCSTSNVMAATIVTDGTNLTGINGVDVDGTLYDVTLNDVWTGIDLYGSTFAQNATVALDDLFSDGGALDGSVYDSGLNFGCENPNDCHWYTVTSVSTSAIGTWLFTNYGTEHLGADTYRSYGDSITASLSNGSTNIAFLEWTESKVSAVPVPAAAWLFCSGLLGIVGMARRKAA